MRLRPLFGKPLAYSIFFGTFGGMGLYFGYKNHRRRKRLERRMKELTKDEKFAVAYLERKLEEERWRDHFKAVGRQY